MKKAILVLFLFHYLFISSVFAQTPEITDGLNYLTSTQFTNGSWKDDPYSKALTQVKPSLSILTTDITFSNTTPAAVEKVTPPTWVGLTGMIFFNRLEQSDNHRRNDVLQIFWRT